jgi:hypothetical protein
MHYVRLLFQSLYDGLKYIFKTVLTLTRTKNNLLTILNISSKKARDVTLKRNPKLNSQANLWTDIKFI